MAEANLIDESMEDEELYESIIVAEDRVSKEVKIQTLMYQVSV